MFCVCASLSGVVSVVIVLLVVEFVLARRECDREEYSDDIELLRMLAIETRFVRGASISGGGVGGL